MRTRSLLAIATVLLCPTLFSQIGGNGKDGPFTPATNTTLDTTKNGGVFQFTLIQVRKGVTVRLTGPNPALLQCQGDVDIAGSITANGEARRYHDFLGGRPGAGGYGGARGTQSWPWWGSNGKGPGGGGGGMLLYNVPAKGGGSASHATRGLFSPHSGWGSAGPGPTYGSAYPFDLRGGSGGGSGGQLKFAGFGGAGGGGAVAILANGHIRIAGRLSANGGAVEAPPSSSVYLTHGGPGSGGAVLLRALRGVRIDKTGEVTAAGGWLNQYSRPLKRIGGDGFVRIDAYASTPVILGKVDPKPLLRRLPELTEISPPKLASSWRLGSVSVPGDIVGFYLSPKGTHFPIPPFGVLELDLFSGLLYLGKSAVPATGVDPMALLSIPVPKDPRLRNVSVHVQAFNHFQAVTGRPFLSNGVATVIR